MQPINVGVDVKVLMLIDEHKKMINNALIHAIKILFNRLCTWFEIFNVILKEDLINKIRCILWLQCAKVFCMLLHKNGNLFFLKNLNGLHHHDNETVLHYTHKCQMQNMCSKKNLI